MGESTATIQESLEGLEERLEANLDAKFAQLRQSTGPPQASTPWRLDFTVAAQRVPDGDPWKEKVLAELQLPSTKQDVSQQGVHKTNIENFRR